jgi:hypothetical protein
MKPSEFLGESSTAWQLRTRPLSTRAAGRRTRPPSSTSCSCGLRHQQPAGLFQHVPRIVRLGDGPDIGIGKATITYDDFAKSQLIIILGQNPGTNHPRMLTRSRKAQGGGRRDCGRQPAAGSRAAAVQERKRSRASLATAPTLRTSSCRSGWAAIWRCCRPISKRVLDSRGEEAWDRAGPPVH